MPGDMFESVPDTGDVYLLSRVLQDWPDEACLTVLRNCRAAMRPGTTLLVVDRVVPDDGSFDLALLWDLHLMMMMGGGQRTAAEYRALFEAAGLVPGEMLPLPLDTYLLTATAGPDQPT
ncbi:hypothetical protein GCM10022222_52430 [Amycolatopsis ultiminotia]|uniref:O-methyltransferase C-terminal domain-containing protein n=1 Tax=Amycolatopsis ultiminotia TaxID=543629 RepID=A0ABP6X8K3_9PSEU